MAECWDECARNALNEAAQYQGGGNFNTSIGNWEYIPARWKKLCGEMLKNFIAEFFFSLYKQKQNASFLLLTSMSNIWSHLTKRRGEEKRKTRVFPPVCIDPMPFLCVFLQNTCSVCSFVHRSPYPFHNWHLRMDVYSQEWNTNIALKCDFHFLILSNITFVSYEGGINPSWGNGYQYFHIHWSSSYVHRFQSHWFWCNMGGLVGAGESLLARVVVWIYSESMASSGI